MKRRRTEGDEASSWIRLKPAKKISFQAYKRGTPLFNKIVENHELMLQWKRCFPSDLDMNQILESHLAHSFDYMALPELEWNRRLIDDANLIDEGNRSFVVNILDQSIKLRKKGRPVFQSLVDAENRKRDKRLVERSLGLTEQGLLQFNLYSRADPELKIAHGFYRMLYGDHGPYIEFIEDQINWDAFPSRDRRGRNAFFDYWYTEDRSVRLYYQRKSVRNKPNPPRMFGQLRKENNRPEGYADYVTGRYYVDPKNVLVKDETYISVLRYIKSCREFLGT